MLDNICYLYNSDCFKLFPLFPTNSIDLILTDPPYNIASDNKVGVRSGKGYSTNELWGNEFQDDYTEREYIGMMNKLAKEAFRILKPDGSFITFIDRGKPYYLHAFYRLLNFRNSIDFIIKNPAQHLRKNNYRSGYETVYWFSKNYYNINFISQKNMINVFYGSIGFANKKETDHPTEKYLWMIKPLIERHSRKGDVILDPFMGSGSVMKVCLEMGRNIIGIEIKKEYCEMIKKRCFGKQFLDRKYDYKYFEIFNNQFNDKEMIKLNDRILQS